MDRSISWGGPKSLNSVRDQLCGFYEGGPDTAGFFLKPGNIQEDTVRSLHIYPILVEPDVFEDGNDLLVAFRDQQPQGNRAMCAGKQQSVETIADNDIDRTIDVGEMRELLFRCKVQS